MKREENPDSSPTGKPDYLLKVLLVGELAVGKSSLVQAFQTKTFRENYHPTIGVDFKLVNHAYKGKKIKIQIWDTAGQERFKTLIRSYYHGAHGVIYVFDLTSRKSWEAIERWVEEVKTNAPETVQGIIVGNKCDLIRERKVNHEEAETLARADLKMKYVETSALQCMNVKEAFEMITEQVVDNFEKIVESEKESEALRRGFKAIRIGEVQDLDKNKNNPSKSSKFCC
jgi:small GTP-binding protein